MFVFILVLSDYLVQSVKVLPFYKYIFFMQNVCRIKIVNSLIREVISFRVMKSNISEIPMSFLNAEMKNFRGILYSYFHISVSVKEMHLFFLF